MDPYFGVNGACGYMVLAIKVRTVNPRKPWTSECTRVFVARKVLIQPIANWKKKSYSLVLTKNIVRVAKLPI